MTDQVPGNQKLNQIITEILQFTGNVDAAALIVNVEGKVLATNQKCEKNPGLRCGEKISWKLVDDNPQGRKGVIAVPRNGTEFESAVSVELLDSFKDPLYLLILDFLPDNKSKPASGKTIRIEDLPSSGENASEAMTGGESRYQELIQSFPDPVALVDSKGVIVAANQLLTRMMDATKPTEIIGKKLTRLFVFDTQRQSLVNILANLSYDDSYREKHTGQSLIGRKFPVELSLRAILNSDKKPSAYMVVVKDISVQERTLLALRTSAAYYRAIVEDNPEMIVRYTPAGIVTFANLAYANFYGLQRNDMLGTKLLDIIPSSSKQRIQNILDFISPEMKPAVKEHSVKQNNGNVRWYRWKTIAIHDDTGEFIEYQSIGEDITDQKNAEADSLQFERKLQDLMENIKLAALIIDLNGIIKFCNTYYLELTGYKKGAVIESSWIDAHVPQNEEGRLRRDLLDAAPSGKIPQRLDALILTKKGEQRLIAWNNALLRSSTGEIIAIALIGEDITDKRITEKTQEAIYKISHSANDAGNLDELFLSIHQILKELMPADNFFIALFDEESNRLSFPYYKDNFDGQPHTGPLGRGLTDYVLRTGKTVLANPEVFNLLVEENEVVSVGAPSVDWLGAPLKVGSKVIGVMVTQTYSEEVRLQKRDEQMFNFVSTQVAMAIDRKQAEQALRLSQRRNELLVQASTDGIVLETLEGDILDCNQIFEEMYGYSRKELLQMKIKDLIPEDYLVDKPDFIEWELSQGGFIPEIPNLRKDGSVFPVEVSTRLTAIDQAQLVVAYVRDITERKKSEQAIIESEAKFRALAETAAAGIFIHRGRKNLYVNPTLCQITGYSEAELLKKNYWDIAIPESAKAMKESFAAFPEGDDNQKRFEVAILNKVGEKKWLDITAGVIDFEGERSFINTAVDISNRKQREHELEVVAKISEALRASLSRDEVHEIILNELMELLDIDGAVSSVLMEEDSFRLAERAIGCWSQLDGTTIKLNEGLSGHIVITGKPYINNHASHDPYFSIPGLVQTLTSIVGVPLIAEGGTIGALVIGSAHVLSEYEQRLLSAIGNLAAGAVHRSDLHDQTLQQATELKIAYDATLEGWALALEMRDKETQGHSLRIANMTLRLAKRLGYRDEDLENVRRGALTTRHWKNGYSRYDPFETCSFDRRRMDDHAEAP